VGCGVGEAVSVTGICVGTGVSVAGIFVNSTVGDGVTSASVGAVAQAESRRAVINKA